MTQSWWQLVGKPFIRAATIDDESAFSGVSFNILHDWPDTPNFKKGWCSIARSNDWCCKFSQLKMLMNQEILRNNPISDKSKCAGMRCPGSTRKPQASDSQKSSVLALTNMMNPPPIFSSFICFHHKIWVATGMVYGGYQFMKIHHTHLFEFKCFSTINLPSTHTWRGIVFIPVSLGPARPGPVGSPHNTRRCTDKEPPVEQGMKQEVPEVKNWRQLLGRCKYMCIYI